MKKNMEMDKKKSSIDENDEKTYKLRNVQNVDESNCNRLSSSSTKVFVDKSKQRRMRRTKDPFRWSK